MVSLAYFARVQLWAAGFYRTEGLRWDSSRMRGEPFKYFAYGVAASEVEVDGFTGAHRLLRVDIVHDVGESLSPLIDLGQIEGGFVQGAGWLTLEDLRWDEGDGPARGRLATQAASTYKLPSLSEMPEQFHVELLRDAAEDGVVYGSKGVGEPPLMLAFSVREALRQAAAAFGPPGTSVDLPSPATPEAVYWALERRANAAAAGPRRHRGRRRRAAAAARRRAAAAPAQRAGAALALAGLRPCVDWLRAVDALRPRRGRGCSSPSSSVRGHAPRDAGAKMVVSADGHLGHRRRRQPRGRRRRACPSAARSGCPRARGCAPSRCPTGRRTSTGCSAAAARSAPAAEPLPVWPSVAVFGVGHVGLELARVLARSDLDLHLVDSRPAQLAR